MMGSYVSRHSTTDVIPKPVEVLPATESWSTLDAFQATVKKNEHHELINRSKTQKSLLRSSSLLKDNYKRTKTLTAISANLPPLEQQSKVGKKHVTVRANTQFNMTPTSHISGESDRIQPLPHTEHNYSQSNLNTRRGTHFYEVRQAMVNRKNIRKLEHLFSEEQNQSSSPLEEVTDNETVVDDEPDTSQLTEKVVENVLVHKPHLTGNPKSSSQSIEHLEKRRKDTQQEVTVSEPLASAFKVDPVPPSTFAPYSQLSERELECQATIAEITPLNPGDPTREEIKEILQQWRDSGLLASIEAHALSPVQSQATTISELAHNLVTISADYIKATEGNDVHIQIAKAYCVYVWIAYNITYDVEHWKLSLSEESGVKCSTDAEEVFNTRVTVCTGYANLFKALAGMCGLEVEVIHGYAKLWKSLSEERPDADMPFKPTRENAHTWNSVMLGCVPCLLDCTFASGYVTSAMNFHKSFNRHYFCVQPQHLILTHWPSSDSWQLLRKPLTLEKFQPLIPLPSSTIGLGIEPEVWSEVIEILDDPVVRIKLRCPNNLTIFATLVATKEDESNDPSTNSKQEWTFVTREENCVSIQAVLPHKGQYVLNIYACESLEQNSSSNYHLVLSYLIQNKREVVNQVGYPTVDNAASSKFNFKLLHWNASKRDYCCENSGKLYLVFRARPDLQFYHYISPGKVTSGITSGSSQANDSCHFNTIVAQNEIGDPGLYMLRTIFPSQGWWTLYLYVKSENSTNFEITQNNSYALVLAYNIYVQVGIPEHSYPNILSPFIKLLNLDSISASGDEIFSFFFNTSGKFNFYSYLTFDQSTGESVENYTTIENLADSSQCRLSVIFPKPGRWYVHVFGKELDNPEQTSYSGLFVLQIKVDCSLKNTLFPKVNRALANTLNVKYLKSGSITFPDDGSPFRYKLVVPKKSVDLLHSINPQVKGNAIANESLLQHCTSLSFDEHTEDSTSNVCTFNAIFPSSGMWTVQLFASSVGSNSYECLMEVKLFVSSPTPNLCYIKVHPSFYNLGLNILERFLSYNPITDKSEIEIPFNAPEKVQFVWNMQYIKTGEKYFQQSIVHYQDQEFDGAVQDRILHIIFPKPGDWIFYLYGRIDSRELQEEKHNYQSILEININVSSFNDEFGFPHTFDPFRSVFGMKLDKEKLPLISKVSSVPHTVNIPFYSPPNVKLWYDVEVNNDSIAQPPAQLKNGSDNFHELLIEVNRKGGWTVTLYAQLVDSHKKNWTAVLKHTISSV